MVTVLHFALADAPTAFGSAWLEVPLHCLDPDAPDGAIAVHVFAGDGETSVDESGAGDGRGTFGCEPGAYPTLRVDLTDTVRDHVAAGSAFLAVRLRSAVGEERYDLGPEGGVESPSITFWE